MQIVIDIPEELYKKQLGSDWSGNICIHDAIVNGTVLLKGHGKLIDVNEVVLLYDSYRKGNALKGDDDAFLNAIRRVQTIIEADVPKRRKGIPLEENDSGYNCEN